jgi:hypothetical protein
MTKLFMIGTLSLLSTTGCGTDQRDPTEGTDRQEDHLPDARGDDTDDTGSGDVERGQPTSGPPLQREPSRSPLQGCEGQFLTHYPSEYCEATFVCDNGWSRTHCETVDGITTCYCDSSYAFIAFQFPGEASDSTCLEAAAHCHEPEQIFQGEDSCARTHLESNTHLESPTISCFAAEECGQTYTLGSQEAFVATEWRSVTCNGYQDNWGCDCSEYTHPLGTSVSIILTGARSIPDLCSDFLDACGEGIVPEQAPVCVVDSQAAEEDQCSVNLKCHFAATYHGESVSAFYTKYGSCKTDDDGLWDCFCGGETFSVQSSNARDACSAVAELCGAP